MFLVRAGSRSKARAVHCGGVFGLTARTSIPLGNRVPGESVPWGWEAWKFDRRRLGGRSVCRLGWLCRLWSPIYPTRWPDKRGHIRNRPHSFELGLAAVDIGENTRFA